MSLGPAAALVLCAVAAAGCGVGSGDRLGEAEVSVTRDYGSEILVRERAEVSESDTVLRLLDRLAEVETGHGGGFVQSIDGRAGGQSDGPRHDWFFYVNGVESPVGAAEYELSEGDRVWWDHHDWTSAMRVPAVVGSWPEPFLHGFEGDAYRTSIRCLTAPPPCEEVAERLRDAGVKVPGPEGGAEARDELVVLVGPWARIRSDPGARPLAQGPARSGVFATFRGGPSALLSLLDERGRLAGTLGRGGGLVAALRPGEGAPRWVVTGTDGAGVVAASRLLGEPLSGRFAVAVEGGAEPVGVPVP